MDMVNPVPEFAEEHRRIDPPPVQVAGFEIESERLVAAADGLERPGRHGHLENNLGREDLNPQPHAVIVEHV